MKIINSISKLFIEYINFSIEYLYVMPVL